MDRKRKATNGNGARVPKRLRFGNFVETPSSNAWRTEQNASRARLRARTQAIAAARAAGTIPPRVRRNVGNARAASRNLTNRIELLNRLSSMSNANLLSRFQGQNSSNIERILLENNAPLLRRVRQLQGRNANVQRLSLVLQFRTLNNSNIVRFLQHANRNQLVFANSILSEYNRNLHRKVLDIMRRVRSQN
jgi:hypothetical protein